MKLSPEEAFMASGEAGPAKEFAMKILTSVGDAIGATRLQEITTVHIVVKHWYR